MDCHLQMSLAAVRAAHYKRYHECADMISTRGTGIGRLTRQEVKLSVVLERTWNKAPCSWPQKAIASLMMVVSRPKATAMFAR
mmetsp:Transcript_70191/g.109807  ORF Transcript_70191/g.109807 Transcript_70191/m.109807 type:complete len:83 (-) Transcript_70191:750-998(-)